MIISVLGQFLYLRNVSHTSSTWYTFDIPEGWTGAGLTDAMTGAAYAIQSFIPLFVRCDKTDIHVVPQVKAVHTGKPTIFIYDSYPGGIGLSEKIFRTVGRAIAKSGRSCVHLSLQVRLSCLHRCARSWYGHETGCRISSSDASRRGTNVI